MTPQSIFYQTGFTTPIEQQPEYNFDRINGITVTRRWHQNSNVGKAFYNSLGNNPMAKVFRATGPSSEVAATYEFYPGGIESPTDTVELRTEQITQSIFLSIVAPPGGVPFVNLGANVVAYCKGVSEGASSFTSPTTGKDLTTMAEAFSADGVGAPSAAQLASATAAIDLMLDGQDSFLLSSWAVTKTRTVSRFFSGKINESGLGKIYTTAQVAVEIGDTILFDLPPLPAITAKEIALSLQPGWLKKLADVVDTAMGKRQIVETWALGKWSLWTYSNL